jgi:hypothetical protein
MLHNNLNNLGFYQATIEYQKVMKFRKKKKANKFKDK